MRFSLVDPAGIRPRASTIRCIAALGIRWRVMVESWEGVDGWRGRLVFEPDSPAARFERRATTPVLRGRSQANLLAIAHDLTDARLRELLHAFG